MNRVGSGTAPHLTVIDGGRRPRPASGLLERRHGLGALGDARGRHLHVSGQPGVGKSTLLQHLIHDDLAFGRGAIVLDPHGALVEAVVACAAPDHLRALLLVDPADTEFPVGLDLLGAADEAAQDRTVQFVIDLFMTLYLRDQQGPMLHQAIRNGLRLLMATGGLLPELPMLFTDKAHLRRLLEQVDDPWVRHYFEKVWLPWSTDKDGFMAYLTSKLSCFVEDRILRNIVGQRAGLDLAAHLERGRVLLVSLAPARIGALNSQLLGLLLIHMVEQLMHRRGTGQPPIRIYVDEFHELATTRLPDLLAAARKFGIGFVLAHQGLEQLPPFARGPLLESVGTVVAFRQGGGRGLDALADVLWPRFSGRDLLTLPDFQAAVRTMDIAGRPRMERLSVPPPPPRRRADDSALRKASRRAIARPRKDVEASLRERLGIADCATHRPEGA